MKSSGLLNDGPTIQAPRATGIEISAICELINSDSLKQYKELLQKRLAKHDPR
jgi:hypothetical protein